MSLPWGLGCRLVPKWLIGRGLQGSVPAGLSSSVLVPTGLSEMHAGRSELAQQVAAEQAEQVQLQTQLLALTERLARSNERLARLLAASAQLDQAILESEAAYSKIVKNPQELGGILKGEDGHAGEGSEPQSTSEEDEAREQKHS
ncbi:microtubule nucleation factor SSNA1 [Phaenicophaeus curvirostris]|uniref:microtubule nucleation factor SSNA1 n=1 Tax=Phaenicophaeus curvirostris TaxID=33595 RepID=UPI0037F0F717